MGIKKNVFYSSILTVSGYLFPLITFPYVTRVLGVRNIGICNFYDGVISYFILFSMLGIVNLGIREIAKSKNNTDELNKAFSGLLVLNLGTTFLSILALVICGLTIDKLAEYPQMIYIGIAKVLANSLLIEWLYKGLEEFRYITIRTIIVRGIYVISVFIFVKQSGDYILYFGLTTLMFVVNAIINLINARKYVKFSKTTINIKNQIKPYFTLGLYQILTSMYTTINVVYLGFVSTEVQVGYYSTAVKLYTIIISFYTAFTGVMLPRMSSLIKEGKNIEFKKYIDKSLKVLYEFCIPTIVLVEIFTPFIIELIAGKEFTGSITPMRIVTPLMLIIGLEQILIYQILFPMNKDKAIFTNSVVGAIVGISLNILLVRNLNSIGTSLTWVGSEFAVLISALFFIHKELIINYNLRLLIKLIISSFPIICIIWILGLGNIQNWIGFISTSLFTVFYYTIIYIFILKIANLNILFEYINRFRHK